MGIAIWLAASFVISGITKRVAAGTTFFKKPHFRWVAPALRALDHERRVQRANTIGALLNSVVSVLVAVITIMYVLKNLNVDIAPMLTSVGILGIAIGFGAQQLIRDFLAGIFITLEDQYGIGDIIETSEVVGTVEAMGLRITRVRAEDGTIWYLRNGEILRVGNRSQGTYIPPEAAPAARPTTHPSRKPENRAMTIPIAGEPRQPKQLLQNDPFSQPGYTDNFYDAVGGHETFVKLIDVFYDGVATDPLLRPMYPEEDLGPGQAAFPDVPGTVLGRPDDVRRGARAPAAADAPPAVPGDSGGQGALAAPHAHRRGCPGTPAALRGDPVGLHGAGRPLHGEQPHRSLTPGPAAGGVPSMP